MSSTGTTYSCEVVSDILMFNKDNSASPHAGVTKRPKVIDSRSILAGVQGFESLPPHQFTSNI